MNVRRPLQIFYCTMLLTFGFVSINEAQTNEVNIEYEEIMHMVSRINTQVDTDYIYDYEKTKFVPPENKTLLIMGQTTEHIKEYTKKFRKQPSPGGWSAYWAVSEFNGIEKKHTNVTGTSQNHQMLVNKFPDAVLHSAMWMVGSLTKNTACGIYDHVIKTYAHWVKKAKCPVYLRIGYEFDGPHNYMEPVDYIRAYRHIVDIMRAEGVTNVAYVWHSYASTPYKNYKFSDWYPGDDYVDWIGVSIFAHAYSKSGINNEGSAVLNFAKVHKKPTMVSEANPIFGIDKNDTKVWEDWFVNFFSMVYNKNIKAICFINEDWTKVNIPGISDWKDSRLYNNPLISKAWFAETNKNRYLKESPNLFKQLGFNISE